DWAAAQGALGRLTGTRYDELAAVAGTVATLAAEQLLTSGRIRPMFLILGRNTSFWSTAPLPAPGYRTRFGNDPAVFQYYPGRGMQLQALATWGKANATAGVCLRNSTGARRRQPCAGAPALRRTL